MAEADLYDELAFDEAEGETEGFDEFEEDAEGFEEEAEGFEEGEDGCQSARIAGRMTRVRPRLCSERRAAFRQVANPRCGRTD